MLLAWRNPGHGKVRVPGPRRNGWAHRDPGRAGEELSPLHEAWESDSDQSLCVSPSSGPARCWETGWNMLAGESLVNLKQAEAASVRCAVANSQVFLMV